MEGDKGMRDYLSVTQMNLYMKCPKAYYFSYIEKIKLPPNGVRVQGQAYHEALAANFTHKLETASDMPIEDVFDVFSDSFNLIRKDKVMQDEGKQWVFDDINWEGGDSGEMKDQGIALTELYCGSVAPTITPVQVENREEITISDVPFVIIRDLETIDTVIDHKVKKSRFSEGDLGRELQPLAYTMQTNKDFCFHVALKQKTLAIVTPDEDSKLRIQPTRGKKLWFEQVVSDVWTAIQAGIFPVCPNGWHCGENYCGYFELCKGGYV